MGHGLRRCSVKFWWSRWGQGRLWAAEVLPIAHSAEPIAYDDGPIVYRFRTRPFQGRKTGSIPVGAIQRR